MVSSLRSLSSCLKAIGLVVSLAAITLVAPLAAAQAEIITTRSQIDAGVKPWPAPTGHRQPHAADVAPDTRPPANRSDDLLDLGIDRRLRICRGC